MKSFIKKYKYAGVIVGLLFAASLTSAAPGDSIVPVIHPGNGAQAIRYVAVGGDSLGNGVGISMYNATAEFAKPGSVFSTIGNLFANGNTWIGDKESGFEKSGPLGTTPYLSQRLNIEGTFLATSLVNTGTDKELCTKGYKGTIFPCSEDITPTWEVGPWSTCSSGTQSRTRQCTVDGTVVADSSCTGELPSTLQACGSCVDPVLTQANVNESPTGSGNLLISFDESLYENVVATVAMASTTFSDDSASFNRSPISTGGYGYNTWEISIAGTCIDSGTSVQSNTIIKEFGYVNTQDNLSCTDNWIDGSEFSWGGSGYGYYSPTKEPLDPMNDDVCNGYLVQDESPDDIWYKIECVEPNSPILEANGQYYKYLESNMYEINDGREGENDYVYTTSSGVPYNSDVPTYPLISPPGPQNWIWNYGGYQRLVPVRVACS